MKSSELDLTLVKDSFQNHFKIQPEQLPGAVDGFGAYATPKAATAANMIADSTSCRHLLGLKDINNKNWRDFLSGNQTLEDYPAFAMNYAGHQFGNWAGQLGDGRAINIAEIQNQSQRFSLQLKGAGPTAFSRRGDGFAVLRSSVREFLCSEAMYALGQPTTRALSLVTRGDFVWRDLLYDGNPALEPSAVVCRVAPSFIRFGHFELFASRGQKQQLQSLILFCIQQYFPEIRQEYAQELQQKQCTDQMVAAFFKKITYDTAKMVAGWQSIGFTHGVLNTDNMSIHGITLDYGPFGWLEAYDLYWTPNTTDAQGRRYAFGRQPQIVQWNLWQLANALASVMEHTQDISNILSEYQKLYWDFYCQNMAAKLGVASVSQEFLQELEQFLHECKIDMTVFFRALVDVENESQFIALVEKSTYKSADEIQIENDQIKVFWQSLQNLFSQKRLNHFRETMLQHNPRYVLRNYLAFQAIEKAEAGDYSMLHQLQNVLSRPFEDQDNSLFDQKRPDWAEAKPGCSALSCSS